MAEGSHTLVPITPETSPRLSHALEGQSPYQTSRKILSPEQPSLDSLMPNAGDLVDAAASGLFDSQILSVLDFPFNWGFPEGNVPYFSPNSSAFLSIQTPTDASTIMTADLSHSSTSLSPFNPTNETQDDQDILQAEDFGHVNPGEQTPSLTALFLTAQPNPATLGRLGAFSKTIATATFFVEEQRAAELSRSWISPASTPAPPADRPTRTPPDPFRLFAPTSPSPIHARLHHLLALLRAVRLRTLHAFSGWRATDAEIAAAHAALAAQFAAAPARARAGVLHAGALLRAVCAQRARLPFDPFVLLAAVLYLWAWAVHAPAGERPGGEALRVDGEVDEGGAAAWVEGREGRVVRVGGVGVLAAADGGGVRRLLKALRAALLAETAWTSFHRWLAECAGQLVAGERPRDQQRRVD
ncbi:hypothetical protein GTA08_BOTSDO13720 [Botryosphaeria dothidea]|uniref:Uncharacterized protein n=1 Tax=Botryosphaeria dothidea TaxID=55169 RepID=A0A8H4J0E5_9PEZI|nr:hypothetical protein GTA08_BOTSDO13720 [Botryosphaeria dothidea]